MKYPFKFIAILLAVLPLYAYGGGNPEFVQFPLGYEKSFTKYATENRANQKQIAKFYANLAMVASYTQGSKAAPGSVVVMEIYSPKMDAENKPIVGSDGLFEIDSLAAVAVMENKDIWNEAYSAKDRTGHWGFALYNPDGTPKDNDLSCVQCHTPLQNQDYLFTYQKLIDYVEKHVGNPLAQ